jgi:hypothetical protein
MTVVIQMAGSCKDSGAKEKAGKKEKGARVPGTVYLIHAAAKNHIA